MHRSNSPTSKSILDCKHWKDDKYRALHANPNEGSIDQGNATKDEKQPSQLSESGKYLIPNHCHVTTIIFIFELWIHSHKIKTIPIPIAPSLIFSKVHR